MKILTFIDGVIKLLNLEFKCFLFLFLLSGNSSLNLLVTFKDPHSFLLMFFFNELLLVCFLGLHI